MRLLLAFIILSKIYSANIVINVKPDTIYVGGVGIISISVEGLGINEIPSFPVLESRDGIYTVKDRLLQNRFAEYTLQFWDSGMIQIYPLSIDININKKNISQIISDSIEVFIYSNISNHDNSIKDIKPLQNIGIINLYKIYFYYFIIIVGLIIMFYLYKKKSIGNVNVENKSYYKKPILNKTLEKINNLKIPEKIDRHSAEKFYINLSLICRHFINEKYFIRATEMTSVELLEYFHSINVSLDIVDFWGEVNAKIDRAKYGGELPSLDSFKKNKEKMITIIKQLNSYK